MRWQERLVDGLIIGACQAVVLVLILLALTAALGNSQATAVQYQKATACVLAIPADPQTGRDPALVALCFQNEGLQPPVFVGAKGP
jgi:hypothetical protein